MTPEYLEELADLADPGQLWRLRGLDQLDLPADKRRQLDAGVALRRHASHVRQLDALRKEGRSLLLTPLSLGGTAIMAVDTPPEHARLRQDRGARGEPVRCKECDLPNGCPEFCHCAAGAMVPAWPLKPCQDMGAPRVRTAGVAVVGVSDERINQLWHLKVGTPATIAVRIFAHALEAEIRTAGVTEVPRG